MTAAILPQSVASECLDNRHESSVTHQPEVSVDKCHALSWLGSPSSTLLILDMIEPSYVKVVVRVDGSSIFVLVPAMRDAVHVDM